MNKYNSIRETFTSDPFYTALLSAKATPPADLVLLAADMATPALYAASTNILGNPSYFLATDQPRFLEVGLFCNLADGLVYQDNPDDYEHGPAFACTLTSYTAAFAAIGTVELFRFRLPELNQMFPVDYLCTGVQAIAANAAYMRFNIGASAVSMTFATISVDPAYAAKRIIFRPVAVIEHTFPLGA